MGFLVFLLGGIWWGVGIQLVELQRKEVGILVEPIVLMPSLFSRYEKQRNTNQLLGKRIIVGVN